MLQDRGGPVRRTGEEEKRRKEGEREKERVFEEEGKRRTRASGSGEIGP